MWFSNSAAVLRWRAEEGVMRCFSIMMKGAVALLVLGAATSVAAADARLEEGAAFYRKYCGACHGLTGEADGIVAGFMRPPPNDLTVAARGNDGKFPFKRIMDQIEGSESVRAHGDPDMPVWGEVLRDPTHQDGVARADVVGRTMLIVKYLESIQKP